MQLQGEKTVGFWQKTFHCNQVFLSLWPPQWSCYPHQLARTNQGQGFQAALIIKEIKRDGFFLFANPAIHQ